jgi:hypothetical protein
VVTVEQRVPGNAEIAQGPGQHPKGRVEHEDPEHARDRRRDRVGPDQQGAVGRPAPDLAVGLHGEEQGEGEGGDRHSGREQRRGGDDTPVLGVAEEVAIVVEADEGGGEAEGVLQEEGLVERLARRPVEEHHRHRDLRKEQRVGEKLAAEDRAHGAG